jgi:flagellin
VLKNNRDTIGAFQGKLGASLNRLQSAQNLLSSKRNEIASAVSRITDADLAGEAAQLVRMNILSEVLTATLAQANQQPALALALFSIQPPGPSRGTSSR